MKTHQTHFTKDAANRQLLISRSFDAPLPDVWAAWTQSELLDQWWAPHPYKSETKSMDFREGGSWLYAMIGPEGDTHWARADFQKIEPQNFYTAKDAFADEEGNINTDLPQAHWKNTFQAAGGKTDVSITITFPQVEAMDKYIEMGFKEGFSAAMENLDRLLGKINN